MRTDSDREPQPARPGTKDRRVIAGRYALTSEVGRGGMGVVWLARDEVLGRDVAVKRVGMLPGADSPDAARAEREARLAASINHPHVVAIFDLVVEGDDQWLVMEYVPGRTMSQLVAQEGPLSPDRAAHLLGQAADALASAHAAGVVHRDVKPSNILVTADGDVKLTDFGIAKGNTDATLTQTGLMSGSPAYLSPEVASGGTAGAPSDVWALGATLFHALSGKPPYEVNGNVLAVLYQIVHEEPPRLADAGWLTPVLEATMTRDPADRWTMAEVRDHLLAGTDASAHTTQLEALPGDGTQPTRRLAATTAAFAAVPAAPSEQHVAPPPTKPPTRRRTSSSGGRTPLLVGAALATVAVIAILWAVLAGGESDPEAPTAGAGDRSATPSAQEEPPAEPSTDANAEEMKQFVSDYLGTVTEDSKTAWTRLTPEFQTASGGYGDYRGWWATVDAADLVDVSANPDDMTVSYTVRYTMNNGSTSEDQVTLQLTRSGDQLLIAGES